MSQSKFFIFHRSALENEMNTTDFSYRKGSSINYVNKFKVIFDPSLPYNNCHTSGDPYQNYVKKIDMSHKICFVLQFLICTW